MAFVTAIPGALESAAAQLAAIGAGVQSANAAAAPVHTAVVPPGLDEISAMLAAAHQAHHATYQAAHGAGAAIHAQTVTTLATSGVSYDATEVANIATML